MKDNKKKKKQEQVEEPQRPKKERVEVWVPVSHKNLTSSHDIEWPEFSSEKERIRANSLRFKNTPISEAMCGVSETAVEAPEIPVTPVIGSIFNITVNKHGKVVYCHVNVLYPEYHVGRFGIGFLSEYPERGKDR